MTTTARERRRRHRVKTRRAALVRIDSNDMTLPCVLWDESETGARLAAAHAGKLPEIFTLLQDAGSSRLCQVVWRKTSSLGVRFITETEAAAIAAGIVRKSHPIEPSATSPNNIKIALPPLTCSAD